MPSTIEATRPDFSAVKQRQQQTWASGDFSAVAARIVLVAEHLCDRPTSTPAGACSTSRRAAATPRSRPRGSAAPRSASTTSRRCSSGAAQRAAAEGLHVELLEGDAEALPFPDASFDAVTLRLRDDVRPRSRAGGRRAAPRLPPRRDDRAGELDAGRVHRRALPHRGRLRAASGRRPVADALGDRGAPRASCSASASPRSGSPSAPSRSGSRRRKSSSTSSASGTGRP